MGVFWIAIAALLTQWVGYWVTCYFIEKHEWLEHAENTPIQNLQPFEISEVWLRWADGTTENLFSEFAITAFLLWFVDRKYSKDRRYRASEEE
jgi:Na+-driven multidrug efflux pump